MAFEVDAGKFDRSIRACINSAGRLLEDAEWSMNRPSTGLTLALLAQGISEGFCSRACPRRDPTLDG
jgi:hypothetical protein